LGARVGSQTDSSARGEQPGSGSDAGGEFVRLIHQKQT
jgi:hypothetical protein